MQLKNDFAKHINELNNSIDRPYSKSIDQSLFENIEDVEHLNQEISDINRILIITISPLMMSLSG